MAVVNTNRSGTSATTTKRSDSASPAEAPLIATRYKTKTCKTFTKTGECPYDIRCMFAHGKAERRTKEKNVADGLVTEEAIRLHHRRLKLEASARASAIAYKKQIEEGAEDVLPESDDEQEGDTEPQQFSEPVDTPSATSPITSCDPRIVVSEVPRQFPSKSRLAAASGSSSIRTDYNDSSSSMNRSNNGGNSQNQAICDASFSEEYPQNQNHSAQNHHNHKTGEEEVSLDYPTTNPHCYYEGGVSHATVTRNNFADVPPPYLNQPTSQVNNNNSNNSHKNNIVGGPAGGGGGGHRFLECPSNDCFSATSSSNSSTVASQGPNHQGDNRARRGRSGWYRHDPYSVSRSFTNSTPPRSSPSPQ